jgi:hypothetical protein
MTRGATQQDLRYAVRALRRAPAFTLITAVVLAVGIAAVAATWNVFATVVLDAVPGPYSSRILNVSFVSPAVPSLHSPLTASSIDELRAHSRVFDEVAGYQKSRPVTVRIGSVDHAATPLLVSTRFFEVFAVAPLGGRWFGASEFRAGHDRVVVLSERFWREALDGDADLVGTAIHIDGQPYTVVGVMPRSFTVPQPNVDLWMPETLAPVQFHLPKARMENTIARLRAGVSLQEAKRYAAALIPAVDRQTGEDLRFGIAPLRDSLVGQDVEHVLRLFLAAVMLVCSSPARTRRSCC